MRKINLDNYRKEEKEARITFERKQRENRKEIDCVVNKLTSGILKQFAEIFN